MWAMWNIDPFVLIPLGLTAWVYLRGMRNVWARAGAGHGITRRHLVCFLSALTALVIALVSPLDAQSEILFSAHMAQHMLLVLVAAPLLVLGNFPLALVWAVPVGRARVLGRSAHESKTLARVWNALSSPISACVLFALALWGWHAPVLFQAALQNNTIHALEHFVFLVTAMLFWWVLFKPGAPNHFHYGRAVPYLFVTTVQSGILGALMTFSTFPWYPYYATAAASSGPALLADQQLAGLIMWFPGDLIFSVLTIGYFAAWLRALEQRSAALPPRDFLKTN